MKTGPQGIALLKGSEGFKARPYLCPAGVATIGYGSTYYPNGKKVTMKDAMITEHEACVILEHVLVPFEAGVSGMVKISLKQGEFDALVSFSYNLGLTALRNSTLMRKLNAGDKSGAARQFGSWINANGKPLPGLITRRENERKMFLGAV